MVCFDRTAKGYWRLMWPLTQIYTPLLDESIDILFGGFESKCRDTLITSSPDTTPSRVIPHQRVRSSVRNDQPEFREVLDTYLQHAALVIMPKAARSHRPREPRLPANEMGNPGKTGTLGLSRLRPSQGWPCAEKKEKRKNLLTRSFFFSFLFFGKAGLSPSAERFFSVD